VKATIPCPTEEVGTRRLGRSEAQAIEIHDSSRNAAIGKKRRATSTSATTGSLTTRPQPKLI